MIKKLLPKGEFSKNVLTLMTGTTIAQAIPVAISPILTRIYSPDDFGSFALYVAMVMVLTTIVTGRYELAIIMPKDDDHAIYLVLLTVVMSIASCFVALCIVVIFHVEIVALLGNPKISYWLYLLPISILFSGIYQGLYYWLNRKSQYKQLAMTKVAQGGSVAGIQLGGGVLIVGAAGLILGNFIGQLTGIIFFCCAAWKDIFIRFKKITLSDIKKLAVRYKKFPLLQAPSTLIEASSAQLPIVLLSIFFGPMIVGFYSLSQKVVRVPISVIGISVGNVFRQQASKDYIESGDCTRIFTRTLMKMVSLSLPFFIVFIIFSPDIFGLVFGEKWRIAGEYAQILSPLFWLSFIVSPLSVMIFIAEKQGIDLVIQVLLVTFSSASLAVGYYVFSSPKFALSGFTFIYCLKYLAELFISYKACVNQRYK